MTRRYIPNSLMPPKIPVHDFFTLMLVQRVFGGPAWMWGAIWMFFGICMLIIVIDAYWTSKRLDHDTIVEKLRG